MIKIAFDCRFCILQKELDFSDFGSQEGSAFSNKAMFNIVNNLD